MKLARFLAVLGMLLAMVGIYKSMTDPKATEPQPIVVDSISDDRFILISNAFEGQKNTIQSIINEINSLQQLNRDLLLRCIELEKRTAPAVIVKQEKKPTPEKRKRGTAGYWE